jgi:hypothetical protein
VSHEVLTTQFYNLALNQHMSDDSIYHVNRTVYHSGHIARIFSSFVGISTGCELVPGTGKSCFK